jgi:hypothetical protein
LLSRSCVRSVCHDFLLTMREYLLSPLFGDYALFNFAYKLTTLFYEPDVIPHGPRTLFLNLGPHVRHTRRSHGDYILVADPLSDEAGTVRPSTSDKSGMSTTTVRVPELRLSDSQGPD